MQLVDEFTPATKTNYLLVDAWYTSGKLMLHALKRGYHTIGRIKSNRVIYPFGLKPSVKEFSTYIRKNETCPVILKYYQNRWDIEVSYRYHKNSLGFDQYQVQSLTFIKRYWSMVFMTYTFLELFRTSKSKVLGLKTIGDTIGYFRQQYMVEIVKASYSCAAKGLSLSSMITKLGLVA